MVQSSAPDRGVLISLLDTSEAHPALWGAVTVILAATGYGLTLATELGLGDTAILIDQMLRLDLSSHVNSHNLTLVVGWLTSHLPLGTTATRAHAVSWLFGTLGVGLTYALLRQWRIPAPAASLCTLVLAASHSYWWHSTLIESYAANGALLLGTLSALYQHQRTEHQAWLGLAAGLSGLALFNHVQMGTLGLACLTWAVIPWTPGSRLRKLATVVGAGALGLLPWLTLLVRDLSSDREASEVLRWAAGGDFQGIMFTAVGSPLRTFAELSLQQFPSPFLLLIPAGLWVVQRDRELWSIGISAGVIWTLNTGFFLFYRTWDQFAFYLPTWITMALCGSLAVRELYRRWRRATLLGLVGCFVVPVSLYPQIPAIAAARPDGYWAQRYPDDFTRNTHDVRTYLASPDKSDWTDVRDYADALFEALPHAAVFFDDDSRTYYPLHFYRTHEGARPDLRLVLVNSWGFDNWGASEERVLSLIRTSRQPVYVVTDLEPFRSLLSPLFEEGWRLRPVDLGKGRWVYTLLPSAEPETSAPIGAMTVAPRNKKRMTGRLGRRVLAHVELPAGRTPRWVQWQWLRPDGSEAPAPAPALIPSKDTQMTGWLQVPADAEPGTWTVVLSVDGVERRRGAIEVTAE